MKELLDAYRAELIDAIRAIDETEFQKAIDVLLDVYRRDRQVFIAGNGGSAGTANHFVCDFGKNAVQGGRRRFRIHSLCDNVEVITALGNDIAFEEIFAFQLENQMRPGDVLMTLSTSGNSANCVHAAEVMRAVGGKVVAFTGARPSALSRLADATIAVPETETYRVQELHLPVYHALCAGVEAELFA